MQVDLEAIEPRAAEPSSASLRAGIIGLDTSHAVAFTQLLNAGDPKPAPKELHGPKGPDPTRYGDWENKGIASDF